MIGVDWGTTTCRAYRLRGGEITDRVEGGPGILRVLHGDFGRALREMIGPWINDGEDHVLISGMIGSKQGWREVPYIACPAGRSSLAIGLQAVSFAGACVQIVPGLSTVDRNGVPDYMRGEETQLVGTDITDGVVCLPGTHSKWATLRDGRVVGFATYLTGETFAALREHTILSRLISAATAHDETAFAAGVARAADAGGLLHHLFGVRALGLTGALASDVSSAYLSGLLIGHEVRAALTRGEPVHVVGAPELVGRYVSAISLCGGDARPLDGSAAARGLARIAAEAGWS